MAFYNQTSKVFAAAVSVAFARVSLAQEPAQSAEALGFLDQWRGQVESWFVDQAPAIFGRAILFLLVLSAFFVGGKLVGKLLRRVFDSTRMELSSLGQGFVISVTVRSCYVLGLLVAISQLGIDLAPLLAGLGVVGFIVGFAMQDTLSNFVAGLMILAYRPFDVDDSIDAGGVKGQVVRLSLSTTIIRTFDNQRIVVPNSKIWGNVITNITAEDTRRVDMKFGIGYGDDIARADAVLHEIVENHELILDEPAPVIRLHNLGESSVEFIVRPWVMTDDYWPVFWDVTRAVKERFDAESISIPYPQRDVHLIKETA